MNSMRALPKSRTELFLAECCIHFYTEKYEQAGGKIQRSERGATPHTSEHQRVIRTAQRMEESCGRQRNDNDRFDRRRDGAVPCTPREKIAVARRGFSRNIEIIGAHLPLDFQLGHLYTFTPKHFIQNLWVFRDSPAERT